MTTIERSIVIGWQTTLVESQPLTAGPRCASVRRYVKCAGPSASGSSSPGEFTEYEPPTKSSFRNVSEPVPMTGAYILEQVDSATKLTTTGKLDAHGFFKLAEPVFARMAGRELEASLGHLKDLPEAAENSS